MLSCVNSNVDAGGEKIAEAFKVIVEWRVYYSQNVILALLVVPLC